MDQASNAAEAAALQALFTTLQQTYIVNYALVGALTTLVYDIFTNMGQEIDHIWRSSWSLPKVLYLISRYYAPLHMINVLWFQIRTDLTDAECEAWLWLYSIGGLVVVTTTIDMILVLRLHALYNQNKKILVFLVTMMSVQFVLELVVTLIACVTAKATPLPPIPWPGCLMTGIRSLTLISWIPNIFVAFICAVMLFYKGISTSDINWRNGDFSGISPLVQTFVFDGAIFFVITFATVLVSAVTTATVRNPLVEFTEPWLIATYSISGTRLIINLRVVAKVPRSMRSQGDTTMTVSRSLPQFARNMNLQDSYELEDISTIRADFTE